MQKTYINWVVLLLAVVAMTACKKDEPDIEPEYDSSQFALITDVVPDAILEIRYFSTYNFIGDRIPGYDEPVALLLRYAVCLLLS